MFSGIEVTDEGPTPKYSMTLISQTSIRKGDELTIRYNSVFDVSRVKCFLIEVKENMPWEKHVLDTNAGKQLS